MTKRRSLLQRFQCCPLKLLAPGVNYRARDPAASKSG
jgi:hypothetical protein